MKKLLLIALLCVAATPVPPKPRLSHVSILSPKHAEQLASLRKVPAPAAPKLIIPSNYRLTWTQSYDLNNPQSALVFIVYQSTNLSTWDVVATVATNLYPFNASLPAAFFQVQASNIVSHAVSR